MAARKPAARIATPRLRGQLDVYEVGSDGVEDEDRLTDVSLDEQDLSDLVARFVEISGGRLTKGKLGGSELEKAILVDVVLDHCDLANARWSDASGTRLAV